MKTNLIPEYDKLFYNTAINRFPLSALVEFDELLKKLTTHEAFKDLIKGVKTAKSMIYSINGFYKESFEIMMEQLEELSMHTYVGYSALINSAINTSEKLDKTEIVMPYADEYLKYGEIELYGKIFVLNWLVKYHPNKNYSFTDFEDVFLELCDEMGYVNNKNLDFKTRVALIMKEFHRANKDLHQFKINISGLSPNESNIILDEFQKTEPLSYFRQQVTAFRK
ncbi:MAG: hypothetical protein ABIP95_10130 [Pelobium sp.]